MSISPGDCHGEYFYDYAFDDVDGDGGYGTFIMTRVMTSCDFVGCHDPLPCCDMNDCGVEKNSFGTCDNSLLTLTCEDGSPGSGVVSATQVVYECSGNTYTLTR